MRTRTGNNLSDGGFMAITPDHLALIARSASDAWERAMRIRNAWKFDSTAAKKLLAEITVLAGQADDAGLLKSAKELRDAGRDLSSKLRGTRQPPP